MNKSQLPKKEGLGTLARPRFFPGLLLEDEDLTAAVEYTRNMVRLLFRSMFGCGVICGLTVDGKVCGTKLTLTIHRGIALDCLGNPIEIPKDQQIDYVTDCDKPFPPLWVGVCYEEKCCRPRDVSCSTDDDGQFKHTRSMDGYEIQIYTELPTCACYCPSKDDKPPTQATDECCSDANGTQQAAASATASSGGTDVYPENEALQPRPEQCACYDKHILGECACDCGCKCVLVAQVTVDAQDEVHVVDRRRMIRPIPVGYLECLPYVSQPKEPPAPPPPSTDTPIIG